MASVTSDIRLFTQVLSITIFSSYQIILVSKRVYIQGHYVTVVQSEAEPVTSTSEV